MKKKDNHICKTCGKSYYFCDHCDGVHNYLEVACSPDCYIAYQNAVLTARATSAEHVVPDDEAPATAPEAKTKPLKAGKHEKR